MRNNLTCLKTVCDFIHRRIVLLRDGPVCPVCSAEPASDRHHLVGRGHLKYRYNPNYSIAVGAKCHERPMLILAWLKTNRLNQYRRVMAAKKRILNGAARFIRIDYEKVYSRLLAMM